MARRDLGNRSSPVDQTHMKGPSYEDALRVVTEWLASSINFKLIRFLSAYYMVLHFEITSNPCNLIGSDCCKSHRTIFCSKSDLFLFLCSESHFLFCIQNHVKAFPVPLFCKPTTGSIKYWYRLKSCILAINLCDFKMDVIKW